MADETAAFSENWQARYSEICTAIRTTDDISFKLLGFVPLVSGVGIFAVLDFLAGEVAWWPTTVFISLFGATITFALFRWELRNIETCEWLKDRAEEIEHYELGLVRGPFYGRKDPPTFLGIDWGKTQAEKLLYISTIVAWVLLPAIVRYQ